MMTTPPAIDYTNKDFASLRRAMLDLARYRLPEWTDQSPGDLGMLLVDLFASMGDVILYYQDRVATESFLQTAVERRSVLNALRLTGYEVAPPAPAAAELTLVFNSPTNGSSPIVTIRQGAQFERRMHRRVLKPSSIWDPVSTSTFRPTRLRGAPMGRSASTPDCR